MHKKESNIIKFKSSYKSGQDVKDSSVTTFVKKTLYKNAYLVNIASENSNFVDILVENNKISKIEPAGSIKIEENTQVFDLDSDFVIPPFINGYTDWTSVLNIALGEEYEGKTLRDRVGTIDEKLLKYVVDLMCMKSVLAGVTGQYVISDKTFPLENMAEVGEDELSALSELASEEDYTLYLKVGQDLDELGTVDKMYGKPLVYVLEDFGILDRKWVLVGGNCFEKDDLKILREYGQRYVVCPSEDGQMGRRPANLNTLKNLDFDIRIGSGRAFEIDFFAYMRQILMTQWGLFEDRNIISEKEVLQMATNCCEVEVGQSADFIVVRNGNSLYENPIKSLIWGKSKNDVVMTVYEGVILQKNGKLISGNTGFTKEETIKEILKMIRRK